MAKKRSNSRRPEQAELVTRDVLAKLSYTPTGLTSFAGQANPTTVFNEMMQDQLRAFRWYREIEEKDAEVAYALMVRKIGVLARPWTVTPASDKDARAVAIAEDVNRWLDSIPRLDFAFWELLDAHGYGVAIAEILWQVDAEVRIAEIKARPQELFTFSEGLGLIGQELQMGPLRLRRSLADLKGTEVPENKFIVHSFEPRHGNRRGRPLIRRVFWPHWFKTQTMKLWLKYLEKGPGTIVVKYPAAAGAEDKKKALAAAEAIADEIAVAVHENLQVMEGLLNQARPRTGEDFRLLLDSICNVAISRQILGQTLTGRGGEAGSGSYALGMVHQDVRFDIVAADAGALSQTINDQLIAPLVLYNHGPEALERELRPYFQVQIDPGEDLDKLADRVMKLRQQGVPIPLSWVRERFGIPTPEGDEPVLTAPTIPGLTPGFM